MSDRLTRLSPFVERLLFGKPDTRGERMARTALVSLLFVAGAVHWVMFFQSGQLSLKAYDWLLQSAYLDTLREALVGGIVPWTWSQPYYHGTQYFLSNPEVTFTPDIILLRWMPNGLFVLVHALALYAVGFVGSLRLASTRGVGFVAFLFFWLIFNFNGFITSHLAAGHFSWTGYFVLPFFLLLVSDDAMAARAVSRSSLGLALILGLLFLNGSFHIAVWCLMFMGITAVWQWSFWPGMATATVMGGLLGAGRVLPALIWFPRKAEFTSGYQFVTGYPSLGVLLDGLTTLRNHQFTVEDSMHPALHWWEFDIYIGFVAFLTIAVFSIRAFRHDAVRFGGPLAAAGACMLVLSLGDVYALVSTVLPFTAVERVSTRFVIMPLLLLLAATAAGIDETGRGPCRQGKIAVLCALPFMAWELLRHSLHWRVGRLEPFFEHVARPVLSLTPPSDGIYVVTVWVAWGLSLLGLLGAAVALKTQPAPAPNPGH